MEVIFSKPTVLGNHSYKKGKQEVPESLAYNLAFKSLVKSGDVQMVPRDVARQKIQSSHDAKALHKAKAARKAARVTKAQKALQSAQDASSAQPTPSSASGAAQPLPTPATPILTGATVKASAPVAPVTAQAAKE